VWIEIRSGVQGKNHIPLVFILPRDLCVKRLEACPGKRILVQDLAGTPRGIAGAVWPWEELSGGTPTRDRAGKNGAASAAGRCRKRRRWDGIPTRAAGLDGRRHGAENQRTE
jgi:hypothetical protein